MKLDETVEGRARHSVMLRYDRAYREHISDLADILVATSSRGSDSLSDISEIKIVDGSAMIKSENARLNGWVFVDIADRDMGSYVDDLKTVLQTVSLPKGYTLHISGQYEQLEQARSQLSIAIPATLLIILCLLYIHFWKLGSDGFDFTVCTVLV